MLLTRTLRIFVFVGLLFALHAGLAAPRLEQPDAVVERVLALVDARLALMPDVAAAKWIARQTVTDTARERVVIEAAAEAAGERGLAREPVEALFRLQMDLARSLQNDLLSQWREQDSGPTQAPSLATTLRPAIDRLTTDLLEALTRAAAYLPDADLQAQASRLPSSRWNDRDRDRLVQALRKIRFEAPRSPARVRKAGILRIGVPADYAPFAWVKDDSLVGADIELTQSLAAQLGVTPVYLRSSWATLTADLAADRFDVAAGGISVTAARQEHGSFSSALIAGGKTALGRCSDTTRFDSLEKIDRPDVRVIENPGGTNEVFARRHLHSASLLIHPDNISIFDELVAGRADVMLTDDIEIARISQRDPRLCRLLKETFDPADKALFLPRDDDWKPTVDAIITPLVVSGQYGRWLEDAIRY